VKNQHPIRAMIVDDEALIVEAIRDILNHLGYTIVGEAGDGRQAVELAQSVQPEIILMDFRMPTMDGLQATRQIQQIRPTPVVLLTAHDSLDIVEQAGAAGVGAYLTKPPDAGAIERSIAIAMARFKDMMDLRRLNVELERHNQDLQAALAKVKQLSGLLPICANCKKIRNDQGYWQDVAVYVRDHSEADFSHGICPDCMKKLYPEYYESE
jgi:AmiR/NasT family two-component response regulator